MKNVFEAYYSGNCLFFKNLFDMLIQLNPSIKHQNSTMLLKEAFIKVNAKSMQIYSSIENQVIWVLATFEKNLFENYTIEIENDHYREINVSVELELVRNFFKNLKKNDSIKFLIGYCEKQEKYELQLEIKKRNEDITFTSKINLNKIQSIAINNEYISNGTIEIQNTQIANVFRNINKINFIDISSSSKNCKFIFNNNDVCKTVLFFGNDTEGENKQTFSESFNAAYFKQISKISTFGSKIKMFAMKHQPLQFEVNSENGKISIWIKSNDMLKNEEALNDI